MSYSETQPGALDNERKKVPAECLHRILLPVNDGRMLELDADSGKLCEGFGDHGTLNLEAGMGERPPGFMSRPRHPSCQTRCW